MADILQQEQHGMICAGLVEIGIEEEEIVYSMK